MELIPHSHPWILQEDLDAVNRVLNSKMIASGGVVKKFEESIASYLEVDVALAQSSGTAALILALRVLGIGDGDEVIIPTYVCRSVFDSVQAVGAIPVVCDVDEYGVLTPTTIRPRCTFRTKAIIAVHIFGHFCDILSIKKLGFPVIEDACQALGLEVGDARAGSLGDVAVLSFHATKCLTTGEGGMLITKDKNLSERALMFSRRHSNMLSDLQAALGLSQLERYDAFLLRRHELRKKLEKIASNRGISLGAKADEGMLFRFTIQLNWSFDAAALEFARYNIQVRRGVDNLLHRNIGLSDINFPGAVRIFDRTVSLPFYPALKATEIERICEALRIIKYDDRN